MLAHGVMTFPSMIHNEPALWPARAFQAGETVLKVTGRWMFLALLPCPCEAELYSAVFRSLLHYVVFSIVSFVYSHYLFHLQAPGFS